MRNMRISWLLLVLAPLSALALSQFDVEPELFGVIAAGIFVTGVFCLLLCIYTYQFRARELLRRLIMEKLNRARHET